MHNFLGLNLIHKSGRIARGKEAGGRSNPMDRQSPTEATVAVGGGRGEGRLCGLGVGWGVGVSFIYVHERINNREWITCVIKSCQGRPVISRIFTKSSNHESCEPLHCWWYPLSSSGQLKSMACHPLSWLKCLVIIQENMTLHWYPIGWTNWQSISSRSFENTSK